MGSKKNLVLASLVGLVMALAFAIGLVPMQAGTPGHDAQAAPGAASVAISVDGSTPVGPTYAIPVGSEQGFSALRLTGSAASRLAAGEVQWSLATDGAAVLTSGPGDAIATVSAVAPGEAALYVSTADGLVDVVDLSFYDLKARGAAKELTSLSITQPENGQTIYIPIGATVPLTLTADVDDPADTESVTYLVGAAEEEYTAVTVSWPYAALVPDVAGISPSTVSAIATRLSSAEVVYADPVAFTVQEVDADADGDGIPDDPFLLGLQPGDQWLADHVDEPFHRHVALVGLDQPVEAKQFIEFPAEGTTVTIAVPEEPSRYVTVTVPAGLVAPGQTGILFVATADDPVELLGPDEAGNLAPLPIGGLVTGGQYVAVDILIQAEGETGFTSIDPALLLANPVVLEMGGVGLTANANAAAYVHPAVVEEEEINQPGKDVIVDGTADWVKVAGGTEVVTGAVRAELDLLGVVGVFDTSETSPNIVSVVNVSGSPNQGSAQAYSIGGELIDIELANVADGTDVNVIIDGTTVPGTVDGTVVTIEVPAAADLPEPATSAVVDLRVEVGDDFDVLHGGLTYIGPDIDSVDPDSGTGGTSLQVAGAGFGQGLTASFDGLNLLNVVVAAEGYYFTATAPAGGAGTVNLQVTNANNYYGSLESAFTYTSEPPILSTVNPNAVPSDGGYTVTLSGANLAPLSGAAQVYFTAVQGVVDLSADIPAQSIVSATATDIIVKTPVHDPGDFDVYVVHGEDVTSDLLPFTFIDPAELPVTIEAVTPNSGSTAGGTEVTIVGAGFPEIGPINNNSVKGTVEQGTTLQISTATYNFVDPVDLDLNLIRGIDASTDSGPQSISGTFTYDTTVLQFVANQSDPSDLVDDWYGKDITFNEVVPGTVNFVLTSLGTDQITTFNPDDETQQVDPFPLANLRFNVVGTIPDGGTPVVLSNTSLATTVGSDVVNIPHETEDGAVVVAASAEFSIEDTTVVEGVTVADVNMSLLRPDGADTTTGPASIQATITYDTTVLQFVDGIESSVLSDWYGKTVTATETVAGEINVVINGTDTLITSVDNQDATPTADQQNPFPLGFLRFNIVGDLEGSSTTLTVASLTMLEADGTTEFAGATGQGDTATVTVQLIPFVFFGGEAATVLSSTATEIVVLTPPHAAGSVDVQVTNPNFEGSANFAIAKDAFTYVEPGTIEVTPGDDFEASLAQGGFTTPITRDYNVVTVGGAPVPWTVSVDQDWVDVDPTEGNGDGVVTVSINSNANTLALGTHTAIVTFEGGGVTVTRSVILNVTPGDVVTVTGIAPNAWWLFGGVVATITGSGFDDTSTVYFGTSLDVNALPAPAQVVSVTSDQIQVVVPPLVTLSTDAQVPVEVGVLTDGNFATLQGDLPVYVQYEVEGDVATSAFFFPTSTGTVGAIDVVLNTQLATGELFIPAINTDNLKGAIALPDLTFGLAHASKNQETLAAGLAPGSDVENVWNFGIHLYYGDYDASSGLFGAELEVQRNTDEVPAVLTFPTDDTTLPVAQVTAGRVSMYATDTDFAYGHPLADDVETGYNTTGLPALYQSNIIGPDVPEYASDNSAEFAPTTGTEVELVRARLYDLSSTFTLRQNATPPVVEAFLESVESVTAFASEMDVSFVGNGLGWPRAVYVGIKDNPAQSLEDALEDSNQFVTLDLDDLDIQRELGDWEYSFVVTLPLDQIRALRSFQNAPSTGNLTYVAVYIEMAYPTGATTKQINPNNLLQVQAPQGGVPVIRGIPRPNIGPLLLGLLAALIGLFAGGGGDSDGGPCFIATAAYGTPMADQIDVLRQFRDTFLLTNPVGTAFVDLYYTVSPTIADTVAQSPVLATLVRVVLVPVIFVARLVLAIPMVSLALTMLGFAMMTLRVYGRRSRKA